MIEGRVLELQIAGIAHCEADPVRTVVLLCIVDVIGRKVDANDRADLRVLCQRLRQMAGATPDIQNAALWHAGEVHEGLRGEAAPATHLKLVPVAVCRREGR